MELIHILGIIKFMGELMFAIIYPDKQATNYYKGKQSSCTAKLSSSQVARVVKPRCQAVKLQLLQIQAVHLLPAHLIVLFLVILYPRYSIHKKVGPILGLADPHPDPDHNQLRVSPC